MAIDTIKSTAVLDGAIATADIADDAVTGDKLSNDVAIANNLTLGGDRIGIGTSTVSTAIGGGVEVHRANGSSFRIEDTTNNVVGELQVYNSGVNLVAQTNHPIIISPNNSETARFTTAGLHLGGTGAANAINDYEEGTATITMTGSSSNPSSAVTVSARYVKIGKLVSLASQFSNVNTTGASGAVRLTGLPFTATQAHAAGNVMFYVRFALGAGSTNVSPYISGTQVQFYQSTNGAGWGEISHSAGTGAYLAFHVIYEATA